MSDLVKKKAKKRAVPKNASAIADLAGTDAVGSDVAVAESLVPDVIVAERVAKEPEISEATAVDATVADVTVGDVTVGDVTVGDVVTGDVVVGDVVVGDVVVGDATMDAAQLQLPEPFSELMPTIPSPGSQLAARREALGLSVERVAELLKMTTRQILAIETDNYVAVHGKSIYRGFVRAYAKILRMEPEPLLEMIPEDAPTPLKLAPGWQGVSKPYAETRLPTFGHRNNQSSRMLVAVVLIGLLVCILVVQKMGWMPVLPKSMMFGDDKNLASTTLAKADSADSLSSSGSSKHKIKQIELAPVDISPQLASAPAAPIAVEPAPVEVAVSAPAPAAPAEIAVSTPAPVTSIATEIVEAPKPVAASRGNNSLVLKCREEAWVELRRANGSVLASRLVPAGTTETFEISGSVQVTIGNARSVEATLRGAPLELKLEPGYRVARLNLK